MHQESLELGTHDVIKPCFQLIYYLKPVGAVHSAVEAIHLYSIVHGYDEPFTSNSWLTFVADLGWQDEAV